MMRLGLVVACLGTTALGLGLGRAPRFRSETWRLRAEEETSARNYHVLLIDDDEALLRAVQRLVLERGYQATCATSGSEALTLLREVDPRPDIIISDIRMPGLDGLQLLQQVRALPQFRDIPMIFLTAKALTKDRIRGYRAGVDAYLPKPFEPEELFSIMENILGRRFDLAQEILGLREDIRDLKIVMEQVVANVAPATMQYRKPPVYVTPREQEVLDLVALGYMNREIAADLGLSERAVEKRMQSMLEKTNTVNRTELVRFALDYGLVT